MIKNSPVLFITAFHPSGNGVIGAGEAISCETIEKLMAEGKRVHVIALSPSNQFPNQDLVTRCASYTVLEQTKLQSFSAIFKGFFHLSWAAPWLFTRVSFRNIKCVLEIITQLEVKEIWLDFPSTLAFSSYLKDKKIHYFVHDVISQKIARRGMLKFFLPIIKHIEKALLVNVTQCSVLAEKDEVILRDMGFYGEITVCPPHHIKSGRVTGGMPISQLLEFFGTKKNLVFFGNMSRYENHASIIHFLIWVYPAIRRQHPDTQLWILGLAPRWTLKVLGRCIPNVHVIGAVDDPEPAFKAADICIAPLRFGAGVKIKVLQMLNSGAIVVSSPIGAEGIEPNSRLHIVPYEDIASTVSNLLDK